MSEKIVKCPFCYGWKTEGSVHDCGEEEELNCLRKWLKEARENITAHVPDCGEQEYHECGICEWPEESDE